ncbi:unnamed protein product [Paramecium octaurelia]|uniref:Uncharacterized protein n=1 Tax=Paramecium octaurelia TaxID=43137 RepID=A0A8S1T6V2_PAROT|nr:unnamed protein product [Paramecium octaurelia]
MLFIQKHQRNKVRGSCSYQGEMYLDLNAYQKVYEIMSSFLKQSFTNNQFRSRNNYLSRIKANQKHFLTSVYCIQVLIQMKAIPCLLQLKYIKRIINNSYHKYEVKSKNAIR